MQSIRNTQHPYCQQNAESIYKGYTLNTTLCALSNPIPYMITKDTTAKLIHYISLICIHPLNSETLRHSLNNNKSSDTSLFTLCVGSNSKRVKTLNHNYYCVNNPGIQQ